MKVTGFNHLSIGSKNLEESVKFYETVLGMQTIPSYNFGFKTKFLRCGDLQLHIFQFEDVQLQVAAAQVFGLEAEIVAGYRLHAQHRLVEFHRFFEVLRANRQVIEAG